MDEDDSTSMRFFPLNFTESVFNTLYDIECKLGYSVGEGCYTLQGQRRAWQGKTRFQRCPEVKRKARLEEARIKAAAFRTDHPAEHQKKLVAVNKKNAKPGGVNDQQNRKNAAFRTDHPTEHQKKRVKRNQLAKLPGGENEQTVHRMRKARARASQTQQEIMKRRRWASTPKPTGMHIVKVQQISAAPQAIAPQQLVVGVHYAKGQLLYCQASADWNAAGWAWCQTNELFRINTAGFVPLESLVAISEEDISSW
jgi:hypothetical protein